MAKKKRIPIWVSLMTRSLSKEKVVKKAGCRSRSENGNCKAHSAWMLGKQAAVQERYAVLVWELLGNAGLRQALCDGPVLTVVEALCWFSQDREEPVAF